MAWNRQKTLKTFKALLWLSFVFAIGSIALMVFNLLKAQTSQFLRSFIYIIVTLFGTGLGCIWFKISRAKETFKHALVHSVVLILMLVSHREIIVLLIDRKINECIRRHIISLINICIYIIQYILSFHLTIFRYGTTQPQRAFRTGLHAFGGVLTFFISFADAVVVWRRLSWEHLDNIYFPLVLTFYLKFFYSVCIWYMLLNPYFDWRRMKALVIQKPSKPIKKTTFRT